MDGDRSTIRELPVDLTSSGDDNAAREEQEIVFKDDPLKIVVEEITIA